MPSFAKVRQPYVDVIEGFFEQSTPATKKDPQRKQLEITTQIKTKIQQPCW
jgi:hypothetical protein